MHNFLEYLKDTWSIFVAVVFQFPSDRFDRINGLNNDSFDGIRQKTGMVLEQVSSTSGLIRYSGANWKARLQRDAQVDVIQKGETVRILSATGNTLIVEKNTK